MTSPKIRRYNSINHESVALLQRLLWGCDVQQNSAYLGWKYRDNPYLDHRYIALAWQDDELVGMVGACGSLWECPGQTPLLIPCLADAVLLPPFRGTNLFRRMVDTILCWLQQDGIPLIIDFGNGEAAASLMLHGWTSIGPWPVASTTRRSPLVDHNFWVTEATHHGRRTGMPLVASQNVDRATMAEIMSQISARPSVLRHVSNLDYIAWWFANPLARYFFLHTGHDYSKGVLVAHHSLEPYDSHTPTTILFCEADMDELWLDLIQLGVEHLPGSNVLLWMRDLSPERCALVTEAGLTVKKPSGQLTQDYSLPNMILRSTGAPCKLNLNLQSPHSWDLRGVCGRSWR